MGDAPDGGARATATLVGCGDLGSRIGLRLASAGVDVRAVRRHADLVPPPLTGLSADITDPRAPLPDLSADLLVVCLTADERDEAGYRRTYVEGMSRALEAACRAGRSPRRAVLVSSTGVYGDATGLVDEATTPEPSRATSRVLLEAESAFREAVPHGTVARLSGLYGDREPRIVAQVRRGEDPHPHRWTNRLHRHDAAAAVVHLLTRPEAPDPLYVVTDDEPCTSGELSAYVAALLGISWSVSTPGRSVAEGRCLSNARLRSTGFTLQHPTYREGYRALLTGLSLTV
ncbi:NAD(P)H-binding protein [uncultured Arsenicicoccus sp.]|uniref:NAD(P)H-binding protein n=1 Tax=uncultured Arsenicicoccus sp. TaxID=491339 RepID=UPI0025996DDF|nr:NAD(P)H-binding protein [uncultured Arsenicicoccus sp.]